MRYREFHYRWEFFLASAPEALWPYVADTNRFNRDAGLPSLLGDAHTSGAEETINQDDAPRRRLGFKRFGLKVSWDEEPFEWVRHERFGVVRRYTSGPLAEMRVRAELEPRANGGTRLVYQVWARPRTLFGFAAVPLAVGRQSARTFARVFRRYDELARRQEDSSKASRRDADRAARFAPGGRERLRQIRETLLGQSASSHDLAERLCQIVERADDLELARLRPYALADRWRAPRRAVLELCLRATRAGLLDLRWELLCPLCRGAKHSGTKLAELPAEGLHCESCRIDVKADLERSVEVVFRPTPSVRTITSQEFCVGGPQVTPHVVAQQLLPAGSSRAIAPALEEGSYRLRVLGDAGARVLLVAAGGESAATFRFGVEAGDGGASSLAPGGEILLENATERERLLILERTAWSDEAAPAADVIALQTFRDLFAAEALRPGDRIEVGTLTVLFTDLRGSTRLYREIGDAVAFGAVMSHFDVLRECVAQEGGAIIKTIGDAVMAVFRQPASALRAAARAQAALASPPAGVRPLRLKAGLHAGPCIAVTLNGRLDYFGSNVNVAARLEPLSTGADIVISDAVREDPQVAALLRGSGGEFTAEPVEAELRGFEAESFRLWRVRRGEKV